MQRLRTPVTPEVAAGPTAGVEIVPHTGASADGERNRRTLRPHRPSGVPRLAPGPQPPPPRARAPPLRRPLQRHRPHRALDVTPPHERRRTHRLATSSGPARVERRDRLGGPITNTTLRHEDRRTPRVDRRPRDLNAGEVQREGSSSSAGLDSETKPNLRTPHARYGAFWICSNRRETSHNRCSRSRPVAVRRPW
jgi:hypothetical protein